MPAGPLLENRIPMRTGSPDRCLGLIGLLRDAASEVVSGAGSSAGAGSAASSSGVGAATTSDAAGSVAVGSSSLVAQAAAIIDNSAIKTTAVCPKDRFDGFCGVPTTWTSPYM